MSGLTHCHSYSPAWGVCADWLWNLKLCKSRGPGFLEGILSTYGHRKISTNIKVQLPPSWLGQLMPADQQTLSKSDWPLPSLGVRTAESKEQMFGTQVIHWVGGEQMFSGAPKLICNGEWTSTAIVTFLMIISYQGLKTQESGSLFLYKLSHQCPLKC